jgi:hypothetical protein
MHGGSSALGAVATRLVSVGLFGESVYQTVPLPPAIARFIRPADADTLRTLLAETTDRIASEQRPSPPLTKKNSASGRLHLGRDAESMLEPAVDFVFAQA